MYKYEGIPQVPMSYDVFLSHNRADKAWTRELCAWLQTTDYNGRALRAWLDEQILDPDDPVSSRQLESGLDRSRFLGLVVSPEALASRWVQAEIDYFLRTRRFGVSCRSMATIPRACKA